MALKQQHKTIDSLRGADVFSAIFLAGETRAEKKSLLPTG